MGQNIVSSIGIGNGAKFGSLTRWGVQALVKRSQNLLLFQRCRPSSATAMDAPASSGLKLLLDYGLSA
jgi:hypothetical protein